MSYRLVHYVGKCSVVLFVLLAAHLVFPAYVPLSVAVVAMALFITLGVIGGVMGCFMAMGKLWLRCPFCGASGLAWAGKGIGLQMDCPNCGEIYAGGRFGLTLFRSGLPAESDEDETPDTRTLEEMAPWERPASLSLLPHGREYFRHWRTLRWYLLMLALAAPAAIWLGLKVHPIATVIVFGSAALIGMIPFVQLASGRSSSNHGTYFRKTEPIRFWRDTLLTLAVFVGLCVGPFFLPIGSKQATSTSQPAIKSDSASTAPVLPGES
jgi:hypothetical protein